MCVWLYVLFTSFWSKVMGFGRKHFVHKWISVMKIESKTNKTNKMAGALIEDPDQRGHPPSLIRVFAVRFMGSLGSKLSSCRQWRLRSDRADAQADLSLLWSHKPFCWFRHEAAQLSSRVDQPPFMAANGVLQLLVFLLLTNNLDPQMTILSRGLEIEVYLNWGLPLIVFPGPGLN